MTLLIRRAATTIVSIFAVGMTTIVGLGAIDQARTASQAQAMIARWPSASRSAAGALLEKYGAPDSIGAGYLTWRRRAPWTRVSVYRDDKPAMRNGVVENVVRCEVPLDSWRALNDLQMGLSYAAIGETLSAASASERANILALNIAMDVIKGRRGVREARKFYAKTQDLAGAGKSSDYALRLKFEPAEGAPSVQPGQIWPWPYKAGFELGAAEAPPPTQPQPPSPLWSLP